MVTAAFPVFVTVTVCDVFCPIATLPKFKLAGDNAKLSVVLGWDFPANRANAATQENHGKKYCNQKERCRCNVPKTGEVCCACPRRPPPDRSSSNDPPRDSPHVRVRERRKHRNWRKGQFRYSRSTCPLVHT